MGVANGGAAAECTKAVMKLVRDEKKRKKYQMKSSESNEKLCEMQRKIKRKLKRIFKNL